MASDQTTLQNKVNAELDNSTQELDALTLAKITAVRKKALEQKPNKAWWKNISLSQGVLATSFSLFAVALLVQQLSLTEPNDDLALLAMMNPVLAEEPEMLSDLEFLTWLEHEQLLQSNGNEQGS